MSCNSHPFQRSVFGRVLWQRRSLGRLGLTHDRILKLHVTLPTRIGRQRKSGFRVHESAVTLRLHLHASTARDPRNFAYRRTACEIQWHHSAFHWLFFALNSFCTVHRLSTNKSGPRLRTPSTWIFFKASFLLTASCQVPCHLQQG